MDVLGEYHHPYALCFSGDSFRLLPHPPVSQCPHSTAFTNLSRTVPPTKPAGIYRLCQAAVLHRQVF
ncbi:uncharacterized protein LY79DRAFT_549890 [Colletotrichum navitas]|uniref:Uncharacterized protein n=1 Tax=Colletotrichum navitas TaxID=681940 RepID=A0AAD8V774_9PEZI|nr:uncharacterized protein LY79DRAFT_549890 [Colletotrichum navitas]KAK1594110.1 hypothetical protein LY79DRAFT_549890 [Colletotrichum navitas]